MSATPATAPPPSLHDGRYSILGPLGSGAQGTTWDAVDRRDGRAVAIKRFDVRGARAWKDVELAEREARVLAELTHPMLPRYIEHFEDDGALYLVMEKIEGTPLSELRRAGSMAEGSVLRLLRDADEVLAYLHGRSPPVIHRDLKPSNVIRRADGSFAFVDFGAVRDRLRPDGGSTVVGTFGYMAPEQFQGRAGPGSDVYAIGATALAMLTGEEPERLPHRGLAIDIEAALAGRGVAGRLRDVLRRMLEVDPDRRPTRIGPLLDGARSARDAPDLGRDLAQEIRENIERKVRDQVERVARRAERHGRREQRRAEERARRWAQRETRRGSGRRRGPPWFVWLFLFLGLLVAQIVVAVTLQVAVPVVLVVLSVLFGQPLRNAARSVARAGHRANDAMSGALGHMSGHPSSAVSEVRTRVGGTEESVRARVQPSGNREEPEQEEGEIEQADQELRRR
jgi:hypothetical protein